MQDIRIRVASASILSVTAFFSVPGALAALVWWLVFTPGPRLLRKGWGIVPVFALIAFFSLVLGITGGGGLSYFIRMSAIILIGIWMYSEYIPGEFLALCGWLLGNRYGFELGMVAEMGMQGLDQLISDAGRIRIAMSLKDLRWGVRTLIPAGLILIHGALTRADEVGELLAVRGYRSGGTVCPMFRTGKWDCIAGIAIIFVMIAGCVPASEFFILYR